MKKVSAGSAPQTLVPALVQALKDQGAEDIIVFVGGVIPAQDYDFFYQAGAAGIFGPGPPHPHLRQYCSARILRQEIWHEICAMPLRGPVKLPGWRRGNSGQTTSTSFAAE